MAQSGHTGRKNGPMVVKMAQSGHTGRRPVVCIKWDVLLPNVLVPNVYIRY